VLAVDDERRLKTLAAFVVLDAVPDDAEATTSALQRYVKSRLTPYKYPRIVRYLSALPKTGTGKVDRQALKAANAADRP